MAVLKSIATGNFTAAGTWGLVDTTSYLNSETSYTALTTSYVASSAFTPGAITVDGIALKLADQTGTTGTISVHLTIAGVEVTGTLVTINVADLPASAIAAANGGWQYFKFASPVLLLAATAYKVEAQTSSSSQIQLFRDSTASNWSRALVTTTTQAPAAGDDLIICGEYTGAGTSNTFTVTMDQTVTTDYGSASTSLVTPAISICNKGILRNGVAAATGYNLKVSGNVVVYSGGELDLGTVANPMPRNSSMTLLFDCGANVDFGLTVRNLGTFIGQGLSRTVGKLIDRCLLNTDATASQTVLGVNADTGWLNNDVVGIASTTRTYSQCEQCTLSASDATSITVTSGLTYAHSGTLPTQAEVILLTRNVVISGASASLQTYIDIAATAIIDCDWVEFKWFGSATTNKRGIDLACTTGVQGFDYCSLHDFTVTNSRGFNMVGASGTGLTINNCVTYKIDHYHFCNVSSTGSSVATNNLFMYCISSAAGMVNIAGTTVNLSGSSCIGSNYAGFNIYGQIGYLGNLSNLTAHSNFYHGLWIQSNLYGELSNLTTWRNNYYGLWTAAGELVVNNLVAFGNTVCNVNQTRGKLTLNSPIINGDTTFSTPTGITLDYVADLIINSGNIGTVSGIKTAHTQDIVCAATLMNARVTLNNTILASAIEIATSSNLPPSGFVAMQKHNQTSGNNRVQYKYGLMTLDTAIYDTTPSIRLTPNNSSYALMQTIGSVNVNLGQVATPSVKVRESVSGDGTDYNGARIKLYVKQNVALGITADTLLATATVSSEGAWETISGACPSVSEDGVLEFYITCNGTTGWINVDTLTVALA